MDAADRENVSIRAMPFSAGAFPGSGQSILYVCGQLPRLDSVHLDSSTGGEYLFTEAYLCKYRLHLDEMRRMSLAPKDTLDLMHAISTQL
jgi:hypothetical protein